MDEGSRKGPAIAGLFVQRRKVSVPVAGAEDTRWAAGNGTIDAADARTGIMANTDLDKGNGFIRPARDSGNM